MHYGCVCVCSLRDAVESAVRSLVINATGPGISSATVIGDNLAAASVINQGGASAIAATFPDSTGRLWN